MKIENDNEEDDIDLKWLSKSFFRWCLNDPICRVCLVLYIEKSLRKLN